MHRFSISQFIAFSLLTSLFGCSYRFTNWYVRAPQDVASIAIEAVYDTGKYPIPHEILWESLQHAFAANGRLRVLSSDDADAYLRAHIINSEMKQFNVETNVIKNDPKSMLDSAGNPLSLDKYSNLRKADQYSKNESFSSILQVEIWHLKKQKLLMKRSYSLSSSHLIFDQRIQDESLFIKSEEGMESSFRSSTETLARQIVSDFLQTL